jgi:3-(3-hydroxy-phenyl)propionate hydroxylase
VVRSRLRRGLAGKLCPNARLADGRRFDEVAAGRFAIVTSTALSLPQRVAVEARDTVLIQARAGDDLYDWLRRGRATIAVVRPDGTTLYAGRDLATACAALPPRNISKQANEPRPAGTATTIE